MFLLGHIHFCLLSIKAHKNLYSEKADTVCCLHGLNFIWRRDGLVEYLKSILGNGFEQWECICLFGIILSGGAC